MRVFTKNILAFGAALVASTAMISISTGAQAWDGDHDHDRYRHDHYVHDHYVAERPVYVAPRPMIVAPPVVMVPVMPMAPMQMMPAGPPSLNLNMNIPL